MLQETEKRSAHTSTQLSMETNTATAFSDKQLSLRELEPYHNLIVYLLIHKGINFKDLHKELQKLRIYASEKTVRTARENLGFNRHIKGDHKKRMIGIYEKWKKRGRNVVITYKGKVSTVQAKRTTNYRKKNPKPGFSNLTALENYTGATPKEIYYYDPNDQYTDLLDLDGCPWEAADKDKAIEYLSERMQGQKAYGTLRTAWEWVSMANDDIDMPSGSNENWMRHRALELYTKYSGNSLYDPCFMAALPDQLLDNDRFKEANEVASLGVQLANSLYEGTDIQNLLAKTKLAYVHNGEGNYSEARRIGQAAVKILKIKCGEYNEDVLQAECCLSDTLLELGELKQAETVCRDILKRSLPGLVTNEAILSFNFQLGKIYNALKKFREAKEILERVVTETKRMFGFGSIKALRVRTELLFALHGLGDWDAITECRQIEDEISRRESNGSPRNLWTLQLVQFVAQQHYDLGAYVEAEKCFRNMSEYISRKFQSSSHLKVVDAECWIANSLFYQGKTKEAADKYKKSLVVLRDTLGPYHKVTLVIKSNLAFAIEDQLPFADYEVLMQEVRELRRSHLGEDHPDTLDSEMFCARLTATRGEFDNSLAAFDKLHEIQNKIYQTNARPEIMNYWLERSRIYEVKGDDTKAEELQRQALDLGKCLFGVEHPRAWEALISLANTLSRQNRRFEAEARLSEGISSLSGSLGKQHPKIMKLELARAEILILQERYVEAMCCQSQVLQKYIKSYGKDHPYVVGVEEKLAESYAAQNRIDEAQSLFDRVIKSCQSTFGSNHRRVGYLKLSLAKLLREQRQFTKALCLVQEALNEARESLGYVEAKSNHSISYLDHPKAIAALETLACIHLDLGSTTESIKLFEKILYLRRELRGPLHPDSIRTLAYLAQAYTERDEYYTAELLYRQVFDTYRKAFGDWHSRTIQAGLDLGLCLKNLDKFSECKDLFKEMLSHLFEHYGEGNSDVARVYRNLASTHAWEGNRAEAEKYLMYALRIFKKLGSKKVFGIMIDLSEHFTALDEQSKAEDQAEKTIYYLNTTLGRNHPRAVQAKIVLAEAWLQNKKYIQTKTLLESLYQNIEKHEGQHSSSLLQVEEILARVLLAQGQIEDADAFLKDCINRRQHIDARNFKLCQLKLLLGDVKEEQGRPEEKESILQELLNSLEQPSFDLQTTTRARTLRKLGTTRILLQKYESAETTLKRALDLSERLFGKENEQTLYVTRILAKSWVNNDRLQERISLQSQTLLRYQKLLNVDPKDVIEIHHEIAASLALARCYELEVLTRQQILDMRSCTSNSDLTYTSDYQALESSRFKLRCCKRVEEYPEFIIDAMVRKQILEGIEVSSRIFASLYRAAVDK